MIGDRWGAPRLGPRRWAIVVAAFVGAVAAGGLIATALVLTAVSRPPTGGDPPVRLVVHPFEAAPGTDPALARGLAVEAADRIAYLPGLVTRVADPASRSGADPCPEPAVPTVCLTAVVSDDEGGTTTIEAHLVEPGSATGTTLEVTAASDGATDLPFGLLREVAATLGAAIPVDRAALLDRSRARDPEAFRLFLRALGASPSHGGERGTDPVPLLERAVELEPAFAPARAALGDRYLARAAADPSRRAAHYDRAEGEFRAALAVDPDLPAAVAGLSALFARTGRQEDAAALLQQAIVVHPGRVDLHFRLGYVLRYAGLFDASIAAYRRGIDLDPDPATLVEGEGQIAKSLVYVGAYAGALALQQGLEAHLARSGRTVDEKILFYEGVMHMYNGDAKRAIEGFDAAWAADSTSLWSAFGRAYRHALTGDTARLLADARALEARDVADGERHYRLVHFNALAGRHDEAIDRLTAAFDGGFFSYPYIRADPLTASLRDAPGFDAVLDEVRRRHIAFPTDG